jgi:hypothetical protein
MLNIFLPERGYRMSASKAELAAGAKSGLLEPRICQARLRLRLGIVDAAHDNGVIELSF